MRKSELIALLSDESIPDIEVVVSADEEGNNFHILADVAYYDDEDSDFEELGLRSAIVLWP